MTAKKNAQVFLKNEGSMRVLAHFTQYFCKFVSTLSVLVCACACEFAACCKTNCNFFNTKKIVYIKSTTQHALFL